MRVPDRRSLMGPPDTLTCLVATFRYTKPLVRGEGGVLEKPTQTPHTQSPGGHSPTVFLATCNGQNSHGRSTGRQSPSGYIEALTGANGRVSPRVVQDSNLRQPDLRSGALPVEL